MSDAEIRRLTALIETVATQDLPALSTQIERVRVWKSRIFKVAVAAVVLAFGVVGWQQWQEHRVTTAIHSSQVVACVKGNEFRAAIRQFTVRALTVTPLPGETRAQRQARAKRNQGLITYAGRKFGGIDCARLYHTGG